VLSAAGAEWKHCPAIRDETDNCDVFYIYHYNPDVKTVKVQKTKRTTATFKFQLSLDAQITGGAEEGADLLSCATGPLRC